MHMQDPLVIMWMFLQHVSLRCCYPSRHQWLSTSMQLYMSHMQLHSEIHFAHITHFGAIIQTPKSARCTGAVPARLVERHLPPAPETVHKQLLNKHLAHGLYTKGTETDKYYFIHSIQYGSVSQREGTFHF